MTKTQTKKINIITTPTAITKTTHVFFLIEQKKDINALSWLKLDKKIKEKIEKRIVEKKDTFDTFFLWGDQGEYLTVGYFFSHWLEKQAFFVGQKLSTLGDDITFLLQEGENFTHLFDTFVLSTASFNHYQHEKKEKKLSVFVPSIQEKNTLLERYESLENVLLCRDLWNTPACDLTPEIFAQKIKQTAWKNTKVKIFTSKDIQKKGLWLIYAVGKGSSHNPHLVFLERITNKRYPTIGFVGKGVIFDTGGLNIKLGDNMFEMKQDMNGAATVFTVMKELDKYKDLKVNIIAAIPLVENAVSNEAFRPSDIVTSYTGKKVQITNTDAEGRLVLADSVAYISTNYSVSKIITVATLTGACMVALGHRYAGIMGNDMETIEKFVTTGRNSMEKYNELPFDEYFVEQTKSKIADLDNWIGGPKAGATMGAAFIANFLTKKEKYIHIDIAGASINSYEPYGYFPTGATGFGVLSIASFFKSF